MKVNILILSALLILSNTLTCDQGFVANSLNICIEPRYIEGCNQYKDETTCKSCDYRYTLQANGLCEFDAETNTECCLSKAGDGSCLKCQTGLYMMGGKCQQSNILGCLQKDSNGLCINCASDFFLKVGSCEKSIKNCASFTDSTRAVCTACTNGHSLYNNICVSNSILGCKNEIDHVCKECYKPFFVSNGNCEISHCKTYNDYKCVACECGFFLTSDGICKSMETGCVRYQRGQCTDCLPNFRLKGSQCLIEGCSQMTGLKCTACSTAYDLVSGGCTLKNCTSWKDGNCEICKPGYNLKNGVCQGSQSLSTE